MKDQIRRHKKYWIEITIVSLIMGAQLAVAQQTSWEKS